MKITISALIAISVLWNLKTASADEKSQQEKRVAVSLKQAVEQTLLRQPAIRIQQQSVAAQKGVLQQARGDFDFAVTSSIKHSESRLPFTSVERALYGVDAQETRTTEYTVGLVKKTRLGIILNPNINLARVDDMNLGAATTNRASLNFQVIIPLLKNFGKTVNAAEEMAAEDELRATEFTLTNTVSQSVRDTVQSYWSCVAAARQLAILRDAELRIKKLVESYRILYKKDEKPLAEVNQLEADLASKSESRIASEQSFFTAQQQLMIAMGLDGAALAGRIQPANAFPKMDNEYKRMEMIRASGLIDKAISRRTDLLALEVSSKAWKKRLTAAQRNRLPQLNLTLNAGYAGLEEGDEGSRYFQSVGSETEGPNGHVMLEFNYPFQNRAAKGLIQQRQARYEQAMIRIADTRRKIRSTVNVTVMKLKNAVKEYTNARKAAERYREAVRDEKKKLNMGMSTIIDVITFQDRLTNAELTLLSVQLKLINSIVQLRYETSTIVRAADKGYGVDVSELIRIP